MTDNCRIVSISAGGAYAGSKAAIEMCSMSCKELGARGIPVNTIALSLTDTDGMVLNKEQVNRELGKIKLTMPVLAIGGCQVDSTRGFTKQNMRLAATNVPGRSCQNPHILSETSNLICWLKPDLIL